MAQLPQNPEEVSVASGETDIYPTVWTFELSDEVRVAVAANANAPFVEASAGVDYDILPGDWLSDGADIAFLPGKRPPAGALVLRQRRTRMRQDEPFGDLEAFRPLQSEQAYDRLTRMIQDARAVADRSLTAPPNEEGGELPRVHLRALKLLAFDAQGRPKATERGEQDIIDAINEVVEAGQAAVAAILQTRDEVLIIIAQSRDDAVAQIEAARDQAIGEIQAYFSYDLALRRMVLTDFSLGVWDAHHAALSDDCGSSDPLAPVTWGREGIEAPGFEMRLAQRGDAFEATDGLSNHVGSRAGWAASDRLESADQAGSLMAASDQTGWTSASEGEVTDGVGSSAPASAIVAVGWSTGPGIEMSDGVGSVVPVAMGVHDGGDAGAGWSQSELAWVNERASAKAQALNAIDVSGLAASAEGANLLLFTGQSFDAGSDNARLFATASRIALMGVVHNGWSVGPDARCVNAGPVYVTYGGDTRVLSTIRENFVGGTNVDQIISDANVAVGNYPLNARGGAPQPVATILRDWLRQQWLALTTKDASRYHVAMSHSKTDGSIAEVGSGDGLARMQSALDVFAEAVTGLDGAEPATVGSGQVDPMRLEAVLMNHGEADESAATATYAADVQAFDTAIHAKAAAKWGQSARAPMLMLQVGGPRYATAAMVCARQQAQMARDFTGQNVNKFVVGSKTEVPSFANLAVETGHPNHGDGHPTLAGNVIMAIRYAVGLHYLSDRRQNYWLPFPHEVYYRGSRFLIAVPCMFPPLREAPMPRGCVMEMLANKGLTFESGAGVENPVLRAEVVPGHPFLIEGECQSDISASTIMKAGKGQAGRSGVVNFRDSFDLRLPFDLPFDGSQTQYGNPLFGAGGDTGKGWRDSPVANGLGRFCEDIPGYVGKPDLGNPMLRDQVVAQPIPFVI